MPYSIELGGYWICNRGHTGYRHTTLPTLYHPNPQHPRQLHLAPCRNCEPFSRIEDVAAAQSLLARLNALFARESKGLPGVSFLLFHRRTSILADHAVDRIQRRRPENLFAFYTRIDHVFINVGDENGINVNRPGRKTRGV